MKAVILAAGYATRLYPLTLDRPKALLPVGGRPMVEHLLLQLQGVEGLDAIYLVTNSKFAGAFREWAAGWDGQEVQIVDDGTGDEESKLGAIGDLDLTIRSAAIDDDLLVLAGDNLFSESLAPFAEFGRAKARAGARRLRRRRPGGDPPLQRDRARRRGPADVLRGEARAAAQHADRDRALLLSARLARAACGEYLEAGNNPDQPGRLVAVALPAGAGVRLAACPVAGTTSARRRRWPRPTTPSRPGDSPARIRHGVVTDT